MLSAKWPPFCFVFSALTHAKFGRNVANNLAMVVITWHIESQPLLTLDGNGFDIADDNVKNIFLNENL